MRTDEAIRHMCDAAGRSAVSVSKAVGRNYSYVNNIISRGSTPRADTLALIAAECGYSLVLEGRGERIPIEPGNLARDSGEDGTVSRAITARPSHTVCGMGYQSTYAYRRKELGAQIRRRREAQGLSTRQFASMVSCSRTHLNDVEHGRASATTDLLERVAAGLDCMVRDLIDF